MILDPSDPRWPTTLKKTRFIDAPRSTAPDPAPETNGEFSFVVELVEPGQESSGSPVPCVECEDMTCRHLCYPCERRASALFMRAVSLQKLLGWHTVESISVNTEGWDIVSQLGSFHYPRLVMYVDYFVNGVKLSLSNRSTALFCVARDRGPMSLKEIDATCVSINRCHDEFDRFIEEANLLTVFNGGREFRRWR